MAEHTTEERIAALATHLGTAADDIEQSSYDELTFTLGSQEYMVMTDEEADEHAKVCIKESLWAFNASFLASYTDLPEVIFEALQPQCEKANEAILTLIERTDGGLEGFIEEAISADGRGHLMNTYDGHEYEEGDFYIYRVS